MQRNLKKKIAITFFSTFPKSEANLHSTFFLHQFHQCWWQSSPIKDIMVFSSNNLTFGAFFVSQFFIACLLPWFVFSALIILLVHGKPLDLYLWKQQSTITWVSIRIWNISKQDIFIPHGMLEEHQKRLQIIQQNLFDGYNITHKVCSRTLERKLVNHTPLSNHLRSPDAQSGRKEDTFESAKSIFLKSFPTL